MKNSPQTPRIAVLLLPFLALGAFGTWSWYLATEQTGANPSSARAASRPTFAVPLKQRAASESERRLAAAAIRAQLDAFKRNDYKRAASLQSQGLRKNFTSTENFAAMIKTTYPQFARYQSAQFGPARLQGEGKNQVLALPITLTGVDGVTVQATYMMVKENGAYRVASVAGGESHKGCPSQNNQSDVPAGFEDVAPIMS